MSDINWDEAKAIHTHAISKRGGEFLFFEMTGENSQRRFSGDRDSYNVNIINNCDYRLIERPVTLSPIYTEAMSNHNILPLVGMEFIVGDTKSDSRTADFIGKKVIVISVTAYNKAHAITFSNKTLGIGCGYYGDLTDSWVQPIIPPKTDTEKAISDFHCYGFGDGLTAKASILALDLIKAGKVHGVTFTGEL